MKTCSRCKLEKNLFEYHKDFYAKDGFKSACKKCIKQKYNSKEAKKYYLNNITNFRNYYNKNKSQIAVYGKQYRRKNKKKISESRKNRKNKDINFRIACNLRNRLYSALNNNRKVGSAILDVGCSIDELKQYLESKFQPEMIWDNYGRFGWHIDHIKPLAGFDLTDRKQLLEACHYTNLQPLWWKENLSKQNN